jgi:hypothetical protein
MIHDGSLISPTATGTLTRHTTLGLPLARPAFLRQAGKNLLVVATEDVIQGDPML